MSVRDEVDAWYTAANSEAQRAAVEQLVGYASGRLPVEKWTERSQATRAIIELVHLTRHTSDRVELIEQLGRCGSQFVAVPALHAESHSVHPEVRAAALMGMGRIGLPFGGSLVARWLGDHSVDDEPSHVLEAALLALARSGHPAVGEQAQRLWRTGRLGAGHLHMALTEAVSSELLDVARVHVADPAVALPAALHLAAVWVDDLEEALRPMLRGDDVAQVHVAEQLLAVPRPSADDHLVEVLSSRQELAAMGRAARRLRVHAPAELADVFRTLAEGIDVSGRDAKHWVKVALMAGIPELQAAALQLAEAGSERTLVAAPHHVCHDSPGLVESLERWEGFDDPTVLAASIRARVNVFGPKALDHLGRFANSERVGARLEYVRAIQNSLRDSRDTDGRSRLPHRERQAYEAQIRSALRNDHVAVQERAAFAAGNVGLTGLADELRQLVRDSPDFRVRRAAATGLSELPPSDHVAFIAQCLLDESEPEVRFRLVRVLLRALESGRESVPAVVEGALRGMGDDNPQVAGLSMVLLGVAGDEGAVPELAREAVGSVQTRAVAAISALGAIGSARAQSDLISLTGHSDSTRRRRAAEALAGVPSEASAMALLGLFEHDADPHVRRAAVSSLADCPVPSSELPRLQPSGPDDPLMFELLQARLAAVGAGGALSTADIDAQLEEAIPGLRTKRLGSRSPGALRALRTAEYLGAGAELPHGLDAASSVLLWTKGLELWLNDSAAPLLQHLREPEHRAGVEAGRMRWGGLQRALPSTWEDPAGQNLWKHLLDGLAKGLGAHRDRSLSLRDIAAALLVGGPLAGALGVRRWGGGLDDTGRQALANRLTRLAWRRNPLTHRRAGTVEEAQGARELALEAARLAVGLG